MLLEKKDKEIERLANFNEMRQLGLVCSEQMLEKDTQNFLAFFAAIKEETSKATAQLEAFKKERTDKTMQLRTINDSCAVLQSQINKKIENLSTYYSYKEFLDELRDPEVIENEAARRKEKLEMKRQRQSHSMDPHNHRHKGKHFDPNSSKNAQVRAANNAHSGAAQSQGDMENNPADDQFTMPYPDKLKQLFDEDSSNESYDLPFDQPSDLMRHIDEFEEKNLSLIEQWQENEEQIENKKVTNRRIQKDKTSEIESLKMSVMENVHRRVLVNEEKNVLEMQNSNGGENLLTDD